MGNENLAAIVGTILIVAVSGCTTIDNSKKWVSVEPVQCGGNAWEIDYFINNCEQRYPEEEEEDLIRFYFEKNSVETFDFQKQEKYETVCLACNCPRGDEISLLISKEAEAKFFELLDTARFKGVPNKCIE